MLLICYSIECCRDRCGFDYISKICRLGKKTIGIYRFRSGNYDIERACSVETIKISNETQFDTTDEDAFRNIRRCSLAPLGESHVVKQFELDNKKVKHFNHVTKVEPREETMEDDLIGPRIEYDMDQDRT